MSTEKNNKNRSQFEQFVEKSVVPNDGIYTKKGFVESNVLEAQATFAQSYDTRKYNKLTKGLNWVIAAVVIVLIFSVVVVSASNRVINVIYAYGDSLVAYEIKVGLGNSINIRDVEYIGPYDTNMPYKSYTGKAALLMKSIDLYDAVLVVCDAEQILELISARYLVSVPSVIDDAVDEYQFSLGPYDMGQPYGLKTEGSIKVLGTGQSLTFNESGYIAFTNETKRQSMSRAVKRFIKLYYEDNN